MSLVALAWRYLWVRPLVAALNLALLAAINAAGVEIPFPQRDLHLRTVDGQVSEMLAQSRSGAAGGGVGTGVSAGGSAAGVFAISFERSACNR